MAGPGQTDPYHIDPNFLFTIQGGRIEELTRMKMMHFL